MKIKITLIIFILFIFSVITYFYAKDYETHQLEVVETKIIQEHIPEYHGFKIVHLADIYYPNSININDLKNMVEKINLVKPDILLISGKIFSNLEVKKEELTKISLILKEIKTTYGIYYNYNKKLGNDNYNTLINDLNIKLLEDSYEIIYNKNSIPLLLMGISEQSIDIDKIKELDIKEKILLSNNIESVEKYINDFNLVFSGNKLSNIINIPLVKNIFKKSNYNNNFYQINNSYIYTNDGIGTNNIKLRLFSKPKIYLYRITKK